MKREPGYYWVKTLQGWVIAEWIIQPKRIKTDRGAHFITGNSWFKQYNPKVLEINETRILSPEEIQQQIKEYKDSIRDYFNSEGFTIEQMDSLRKMENIKPIGDGKIVMLTYPENYVDLHKRDVKPSLDQPYNE